MSRQITLLNRCEAEPTLLFALVNSITIPIPTQSTSIIRILEIHYQTLSWQDHTEEVLQPRSSYTNINVTYASLANQAKGCFSTTIRDQHLGHRVKDSTNFCHSHDNSGAWNLEYHFSPRPSLFHPSPPDASTLTPSTSSSPSPTPTTSQFHRFTFHNSITNPDNLIPLFVSILGAMLPSTLL